MTELNISSKAPGPADPQGGATSSCSYQVTGQTPYTLGVTLEPSRGVEDWLAGKWSATIRPATVSSYPAAQIIPGSDQWNTQVAHSCNTVVSTSAGQELAADGEPQRQDLTVPQLCDITKQLAGLALATLQANQ